MSGTATIEAWLAEQEGAMIGLIENLVSIDSGTGNWAGVTAVGEAIADFLEGEGIEVERLPQKGSGAIVRARVAGPGNAPILLMGHCDTVFPDGEAARRPFTIRDGRAYGPGVADMKAGLVMNAFVLAAYHRFGGNAAPLIGLFTADEEIGSPVSRATIEATARPARAVYNAEPGRPNGNVCTSRKGGVFMIADITGRAAHSGGNYADGRSAILALAKKIVDLHAMTDLPSGITVNVGLISGGQSVNTVAPDARGEIDLRYVKKADRDRLVAAVEAIVRRVDVPDTQGAFRIRGEFLPLEQSPGSRAIYDLYRDAAKESGITLEGEFSGGCADSGFTAAIGAPTLCSTGPIGGKAHTPEEYLEVASIVPRAQLVAHSVMRTPPAGR